MKKRFRLLAGPNGSGKSTLKRLLTDAYSVNFYTFLNADDIFAEVKRTGVYFFPILVSPTDYRAYVEQSTYEEDVKTQMLTQVVLTEDSIRFTDASAVNSYTIALLTNFLQDTLIAGSQSFSQETVFSHPSKIAALKKAHDAGYRTYLYFVATQNPALNISRVASRVTTGGHNVPEEKIIARFDRALANINAALPHCSRAYFFDNSDHLRLLAEYEETAGIKLKQPQTELPTWFLRLKVVPMGY